MVYISPSTELLGISLIINYKVRKKFKSYVGHNLYVTLVIYFPNCKGLDLPEVLYTLHCQR